MPKQIGQSFFCIECNTRYATERAAISCEENHNTIYVKFTREQLFKLIQFMYTGDMDLIRGDVQDTLMKYKQGRY